MAYMSHAPNILRSLQVVTNSGGQQKLLSRLTTAENLSVRQPGRAASTAQGPQVQADEADTDQDVIERKRNKSRLTTRHFKKFHRQATPPTADQEVVYNLKWQRKQYGLYGAASAINPAKLWPSQEELAHRREWEEVSFPHSLKHMIHEAKKAKEDEEKRQKKRQEDLLQKVKNLEVWKQEVRQRVVRQQQEEQAAKEKKERLVEEVRQVFGYRIDPRDVKFKEALEKKEQEEKKAAKAAKKLKKQQLMIERLKKAADSSSSPSQPDPAPPSTPESH